MVVAHRSPSLHSEIRSSKGEEPDYNAAYFCYFTEARSSVSLHAAGTPLRRAASGPGYLT